MFKSYFNGSELWGNPFNFIPVDLPELLVFFILLIKLLNLLFLGMYKKGCTFSVGSYNAVENLHFEFFVVGREIHAL
jgi:hypothetical protein